jgi:hypothetical protein
MENRKDARHTQNAPGRAWGAGIISLNDHPTASGHIAADTIGQGNDRRRAILPEAPDKGSDEMAAGSYREAEAMGRETAGEGR